MVDVVINPVANKSEVRIGVREGTNPNRPQDGIVPSEGGIVVQATSVAEVRRFVGGRPTGDIRQQVTNKQQTLSAVQDQFSRVQAKPGTRVSGEVAPAFTRRDDDRVTPRAERAAGIIRQRPQAFAREAPARATREEIQAINIERQEQRRREIEERATVVPPRPRPEGVPARLRERGVTTFQGVPISRAERLRQERRERALSELPEFVPAGRIRRAGETAAERFPIPVAPPGFQETQIVRDPTLRVEGIRIDRPIGEIQPVEPLTGIPGVIQRPLEAARRAEFAAEFRETTITGRARRRGEAVVAGVSAGALAVTTFPIQAIIAPSATFEAVGEQAAEFVTAPRTVLQETIGQVGVSPLAETTFLAPTLAVNVLGFRGGARAFRTQRIPLEFEQLTVSQGRRIRLPSGALEEQSFVGARGIVGAEARPFTAEFVIQREARPSLEIPETLVSTRIGTGQIITPEGEFLARTRAPGRIGGGRFIEEPVTEVARVGRKGRVGRPRTARGILAGETEVIAEVTGEGIQPRRTTLTRVDEFTGEEIPVGRAAAVEVERVTVLGEGITERGEAGLQLGELTSFGAARGVRTLARDLPTPFQISKVTRRQLKEITPTGTVRRRIDRPTPPADLFPEGPPPARGAKGVDVTGITPTPPTRRPPSVQILEQVPVTQRPVTPSLRAVAELDIARSLRLTQARARLTPLTAITGARITAVRQTQFPLTVQQQTPAQRLQQQAGIESLQRQIAGPAQIVSPITTPAQRQAVIGASALDQAFLGSTFPGGRAAVAPPLLPLPPFTPPVGLPPPFRLVTQPTRRRRPFAGVAEKPGAPTLATSILGIVGEPFTGRATPFTFRPIGKEARALQDLIIGGKLNGIVSRKGNKKKTKKRKTKKR